MNKRGQELSTNAIILIILGVLVLVVLIAGFVIGWDKLKEWINPTNNLQQIQTTCSAYCTTANTYAYCTEEQTVKIATDSASYKGTCKELVTMKDSKGNSFGILDCSTIDCSQSYKIECSSTGNGGEWTDAVEGKCPSGSSLAETRYDNPPEEGKICCISNPATN